MSVVLRAESVSRHFGGLKAVDKVDFELNNGEILGLIGPNGAGKTTLFSILAGSIPPSEGRIRLDSRDITGWPAHRVVHAGVCRTHQIVRPFAKMSVLDNVQVGIRYGNKKRSGRTHGEALQLLELVGLPERADDLPGELTLAGRKRLELARALATSPSVLLLDEVIAGINPVEAQRLSDLIGRVRERGISIIMIEHVMQAVMGLSDRVIVLDEGKKIAEGSPDQVANDSRVVEAYLGEESSGDGHRAARSEEFTSDGHGSPSSQDGAISSSTPSGSEATSSRSASDSLLEIADLDVFYGDAQAIFGLSMNVYRGEIVTLVGSNGAGKTTTLKTVAGLLRSRRGVIRFEGEDLASVRPYRRVERGIALVPEGRDLWPQMTVRENIELGAFTEEARSNAGSSLERVYSLFPKLEERSSQLAGSLSGGEQQMAAIARALMSRPRLLMLDEPSLGLAPILVQQMFDTIRRLHDQENITILLVEQNLVKALELADRAYVIETGRVRTRGAGRELLEDDSLRAAYLGV
jgi:branched-chain amino acid transport system ATP-binding protein